jgi:hypothetical protein
MDQNSDPTSDDATTAPTADEHRVGPFAVGVACAIAISAFIAVDFATGLMTYRGNQWEWPLAVFVGLCIAEVNLIAVWSSLAPGNIVTRLSWSLLLAAAMWYALVLGVRIHHPMQFPDAVVLGISLLGSVIVLQVPLWIAKKVFRWRLLGRRTDLDRMRLEDRQFEIRHMLFATFLLAVALSPLRHVLPPRSTAPFVPDGEAFVMLGTVILCNLLVTIPCIWWAFFSTAKAFRLALIWLYYCVALTVVESAILSAMISHLQQQEYAVKFFVFNVSQCAAVFGTLRVFRALGFRLVRLPAGESTKPDTSTVEMSPGGNARQYPAANEQDHD